MPLRFQNDGHVTGRTPSYYANNKLFKDSYTRNDYQTRTSRRVHDGLSLATNYGLDTVTDDVNSSPFSSPYYINGRFTTQNSVTQRASSASIQGTKMLCDAAPVRKADFAQSEIQSTIEMWQGKQIKFELPYDGKVIGNTISIKNSGGCTGVLCIYFSATDGGRVLAETAVDLCTVSEDKFDHVELRSNLVIPQHATRDGRLHVRMEIYDEILMERSANPFNTGRKIEISATGLDGHYACVYRLGEKNAPVEEKYEYERLPSRPLIGFLYSDYTSIPVNRHEDQDSGAWVSIDGYKYGVFAYTDGTSAQLAIYDFADNSIVETPVLPVDPRATAVNIVQGENHMYYVDGYSSLRRVTVGKWDDLYTFPASAAESVTASVNVERFAASPLGEETGVYSFYYSGVWKYEGNTVNLNDYGISYVGEVADGGYITVNYAAAGLTTEASAAAEYVDTRPVVAPSIINRHNNRIYLGGFRNDPNLFQCSEIDAAGPQYDSYPYRYYVPNDSPDATSTNTISAMVVYESNTAMKLSKGSFSLYSTNVDLEDGSPTQVSTYIDGGGVRSEGDVVNYAGIIYSFDPDEGIRRYNGSVWSKIPAAVDTLIERVDMDKPRKLWGYAGKLYFNYSDKIDGKYKCLIWDKDMNYQQYPWFQDDDIPFCDVRYDDDFDIVGIHPDYPLIMQLYAENTWRRLDSPINFERHTKYVSLPGNAADAIVKRVHNKVIANANRWWYFSLSSDNHELEQTRRHDAWYRMPCWDTVESDVEPENPFTTQDVYEEDAVAILTIPNLRLRGIAVQEKVKCKTFRDQASLVSILIESGVRQYN